jgi:hypothetical protein
MRSIWVIVLAACGGGAAAVKPTATVDCGPPIVGFDRVVAEHRVILVGEIHGTAETPAAVSAMVCEASARGPVVLAIEHDPIDQTRLAAALASGDRAALIAGGMFAAASQDGRASVAMADLVMRVHALRQVGRQVELAMFDVADKDDRDAKMAARFKALVAAHAGATVIAITGNIHAQKTIGVPWDDAFVTMGSVLAKDVPFYSIYAAGKGEAWNCQPECGAHPLGGGSTKPLRTIAPIDSLPGYDAALNLGTVTASPPAKAS